MQLWYIASNPPSRFYSLSHSSRLAKPPGASSLVNCAIIDQYLCSISLFSALLFISRYIRRTQLNMAQISILNILSLTVLLSTALALPFDFHNFERPIENAQRLHHRQLLPQRYQTATGSSTYSIDPTNSSSDVGYGSYPAGSGMYLLLP